MTLARLAATPVPGGIAAVLLLVVVALACARLRYLANERWSRFEVLHAAVIALLLEEPVADLSARIGQALEQIARIVGVDRLWLLAGDDADVFYGWSADGTLTKEAAAARTSRIVARFPWSGNMILVEPGARSAAPPDDDPTGGRFRFAAALLIRSQEHQEPALLCLAADHRWLVYPETIRVLAAALPTMLQLEQRRRLEAERQALGRELALARRMETVGALASGLAHNLNNILNAIDAFRLTATLDVPPQGVAHDNLEGIGQAVERAGGLVADVLRFGRGDAVSPEAVDLAELLGETAKLVTAALPPGLRLDSRPAAEAMRVAGDFGQLQQVLLNLCSNAAKATGQGGGTIVCETALRVLAEPVRLSHAVLRRGRYATIAVADHGIGIAAEAIPRLFDAFYTNRKGGTGLGLSSAREIVEGVGGAVDVDSVEGQGSRFTVWLPLVEPEVDAPAPDQVTRGKGEAVLIVNAEAERLPGDEDLLAALGYEPVGIADPGGLADADIAVDVALVVGSDPHRAADLARRVREAGFAAPLLMAVPRPDPGSGALHYPFRAAALAHALSQAVQPAGRPLSEVAFVPM